MKTLQDWNVNTHQSVAGLRRVLALRTYLLFNGRGSFLKLAERKSSIIHHSVGPFQCLDTMVNKSHELAKRIAKLWSVTMFAILALMPTVCLGLHGED